MILRVAGGLLKVRHESWVLRGFLSASVTDMIVMSDVE